MDKFKEILNKVPFVILMLLSVVYQGYNYYNFKSSNRSPLIRKQKQVVAAEIKNRSLEKEIKSAENFFKTLEAKKESLRKLVRRLSETKQVLAEELDVPDLIDTLETEARRIGLKVKKLRTLAEKKHEYYFEQAFDLNFTGIFQHIVVYLERLALSRRIIRVNEIKASPDRVASGGRQSDYAVLSGSMKVKAYRYNRSKADDIAKKRMKEIEDEANKALDMAPDGKKNPKKGKN